jgi:hypothetical protein
MLGSRYVKDMSEDMSEDSHHHQPSGPLQYPSAFRAGNRMGYEEGISRAGNL